MPGVEHVDRGERVTVVEPEMSRKVVAGARRDDGKRTARFARDARERAHRTVATADDDAVTVRERVASASPRVVDVGRLVHHNATLGEYGTQAGQHRARPPPPRGRVHDCRPAHRAGSY